MPISRLTKELWKWYLAIASLVVSLIGFALAADAPAGVLVQDWGWGITGIGILMFIGFLYLSYPG